MEPFDEKRFNMSTLIKIQFKPEYANMFKKVKDIRAPIKNEIVMALLDGKWHSERELITFTKKKYNYIGPLTLDTMVNSLNIKMNNNFLEKRIADEGLFYKLSDNYIGLTRAAYTKFRYMIK